MMNWAACLAVFLAATIAAEASGKHRSKSNAEEDNSVEDSSVPHAVTKIHPRQRHDLEKTNESNGVFSLIGQVNNESFESEVEKRPRRKLRKDYPKRHGIHIDQHGLIHKKRLTPSASALYDTSRDLSEYDYPVFEYAGDNAAWPPYQQVASGASAYRRYHGTPAMSSDFYYPQPQHFLQNPQWEEKTFYPFSLERMDVPISLNQELRHYMGQRNNYLGHRNEIISPISYPGQLQNYGQRSGFGSIGYRSNLPSYPLPISDVKLDKQSLLEGPVIPHARLSHPGLQYLHPDQSGYQRHGFSGPRSVYPGYQPSYPPALYPGQLNIRVIPPPTNPGLAPLYSERSDIPGEQ